MRCLAARPCWSALWDTARPLSQKQNVDKLALRASDKAEKMLLQGLLLGAPRAAQLGAWVSKGRDKCKKKGRDKSAQLVLPERISPLARLPDGSQIYDYWYCYCYSILLLMLFS